MAILMARAPSLIDALKDTLQKEIVDYRANLHKFMEPALKRVETTVSQMSAPLQSSIASNTCAMNQHQIKIDQTQNSIVTALKELSTEVELLKTLVLGVSNRQMEMCNQLGLPVAPNDFARMLASSQSSMRPKPETTRPKVNQRPTATVSKPPGSDVDIKPNIAEVREQGRQTTDITRNVSRGYLRQPEGTPQVSQTYKNIPLEPIGPIPMETDSPQSPPPFEDRFDVDKFGHTTKDRAQAMEKRPLQPGPEQDRRIDWAQEMKIFSEKMFSEYVKEREREQKNSLPDGVTYEDLPTGKKGMVGVLKRKFKGRDLAEIQPEEKPAWATIEHWNAFMTSKGSRVTNRRRNRDNNKRHAAFSKTAYNDLRPYADQNYGQVALGPSRYGPDGRELARPAAPRGRTLPTPIYTRRGMIPTRSERREMFAEDQWKSHNVVNDPTFDVK